MLDIHFIRENPARIKNSLMQRGDIKKVVWVDTLLEKDKEYREKLSSLQELQQKRNQITKEIDSLRVQGKDFREKIIEVKSFLPNLKEIESEVTKFKEEINYYLLRLPNVLDPSVPKGKDESENVPIKMWGEKQQAAFPLKHHGELAVVLGGADFERAVKISGAGFYILKGWLAQLERALINYSLDTLQKKNYELISPPFLMKRKPYEGAAPLEEFEDTMYKIENDELYLIATAEHPMAAQYMNETLDEESLDLKYCGFSPCFRKEVGKHGLDERGLFRVHQFYKVEQFVFCKPSESQKWHEEILKNSEEFLQALKIPYQVVNVCTGDIGPFASKKYDVEGYSPREDKYIELMSCSNDLTYQAVRLGIKYKTRKNEKHYLHTLNNTMVATPRMLRLILETYQQEDGSVKIPKVLIPYMNGIREIKP